MNKKIYMTTGEFARIMRITKETLFHYDEIGLFQPELTQPNGYRYYSIYQTEILDTILLLKDLGMPLKEIKQQLANRDPAKMLHILEEREHQINTEIAKLRSMEKWISQQKSKIHFAMQIDPTAIFIADFPERYYLYAEAPTATDAELYRKTDDLINLLLTVGSIFKNDYDMAYFQHASHIESDKYAVYDNVALLLDNKPYGLPVHTLPAGKYLTAYHTGHWDTIGDTYDRLMTFKHEHNIHTSSEYLEHNVIDSFTAEDPQDYITEITVAIEA